MWWKRGLVIGPALLYVMTSLLLSCGGSSSDSTLPSPTATPITLVEVRACNAPPTTYAPCAAPSAVSVPLSTSNLELWAQGQFSSNGVQSYNDISSSATWFVNNSLITSVGQGFFVSGPKVGCSCLTAASGTVVSQAVPVAVGQSASLCSPCPPSPPS